MRNSILSLKSDSLGWHHKHSVIVFGIPLSNLSTYAEGRRYYHLAVPSMCHPQQYLKEENIRYEPRITHQK